MRHGEEFEVRDRVNGQTAIAGIILAGGQSRRMGGIDKAWVDLAGRPMAAHVIGALRGSVPRLMISANGPVPQNFGLPVLADLVGGYQGPLAGILAGMRWCQSHAAEVNWLVSAPTDAPFLPHDFATRLVEAADDAQDVVVVARSRGQAHHVLALWPLCKADVIEEALRQGQSKVQLMQDAIGVRVVDFEDVSIGANKFDPFMNLNTADDLQIARAAFEPAVPNAIGIVGWKNSGKTKFVERLIGELKSAGLRVATVKYTHHERLDPGAEDSDTGRHLRAGAEASVLVAGSRWGVVPNLDRVSDGRPELPDVIGALPPVDVVLVEGNKQAAIPKIEVRNSAAASGDEHPLAWVDPRVIAVAVDATLSHEPVPVMARKDVARAHQLIRDAFARSALSI